MSRFKKLLLGVFVTVLFSACNKSVDYRKWILPSDCTVENALDSAKKYNKLLVVAFGDGKDCGHTNNFLKKIDEDGIFEKYKNDCLFCVTSVADDAPDVFYRHILIPPSIPNLYIFNSDGKLISLTQYGMMESKFIDLQLKCAVAGNPINPHEHFYYSVAGNRILTLFNTLIDAARTYNTAHSDTTILNKSLEIVERSIEIEECFYNRYLQTMIYNRFNNNALADSAATKAISILNEKKTNLMYNKLYKELASLSSYYTKLSENAGKLVFDESSVDCGTISLRESGKFKLSFENKGEKPIVIIEAATSCDCVQINYPKNPIMPNERGEVEFIYHGNAKGSFIKTVSFRNNGAETIVPITLKGEVK